MITVLCGGVGAARMLDALRSVVDASSLTGIVNTGDDLTLHGLRICPDLDTITYTLAGLNNRETGWGLTGETWRVMDELEVLGGASWFRLGDRDLATHLYRTELLAQGMALDAVTSTLLKRHGVDITLLPVTNDEIATTFTTSEHGTLSFQEYFVRHHHQVVVKSIEILGAERATPAPGVLESIESAEKIVISPSNPLISIAPILAVPGVRDALRARRSDVVAVSPLIGGKALKGPADRLMAELGMEVSPRGIATFYQDVAATLVIDVIDGSLAETVRDADLECLVTETIMDSPQRSANLARVVLGA